MTDLTLQNGKEITFDLSKMNLEEYQGVFNPRESNQKTNQTLAKVAGLTVDEINKMPYPDYRRFFAAWLKKTREPLSDPNLASASTSANE